MKRALFVFALLPAAFATPVGASFVAADSARSATVSGIQQRLEEVDLAMEMARDGEFGRLSRTKLSAVEAAHRTVHGLLGDVQSLDQLSAAQVETVNAAIAEINELLQIDDKDRRICKRITVTGSRVGVMECLSLAEREARAKSARTMAGELQRGFCVPGQGRDDERVSACVR